MLADRFEVADIFGLDERTVRNYAKAGMPLARLGDPKATGRDKANLYDTHEVFQWLLARATRRSRW